MHVSPLTFFCCRSQAGSSTASRSHSSAWTMYPSVAWLFRCWSDALELEPFCPFESYSDPLIEIDECEQTREEKIRCWPSKWLIDADVQRSEHLEEKKENSLTFVFYTSIFFFLSTSSIHRRLFLYYIYVPVLWNKIPDTSAKKMTKKKQFISSQAREEKKGTSKDKRVGGRTCTWMDNESILEWAKSTSHGRAADSSTESVANDKKTFSSLIRHVFA